MNNAFINRICQINAPPDVKRSQPERFCRPDGLVAYWKSLPNTETAERDAPAHIPARCSRQMRASLRPKNASA